MFSAALVAKTHSQSFSSLRDFQCARTVPEGECSGLWWGCGQTQSHPCCACLGYRNLGRPFSTSQCCCLIEPLCISLIFLSRTGKLTTVSLSWLVLVKGARLIVFSKMLPKKRNITRTGLPANVPWAGLGATTPCSPVPSGLRCGGGGDHLFPG